MRSLYTGLCKVHSPSRNIEGPEYTKGYAGAFASPLSPVHRSSLAILENVGTLPFRVVNAVRGDMGHCKVVHGD